MRRSGKWTIGFFNIGLAPQDENFFGCATLGASREGRVIAPDDPDPIIWGTVDDAIAVSGTYDECVSELTALGSKVKPAAALIFFACGAGAEAFLARVHEIFPGMPVAGGTSAGSPEGELRPAAKDVSLLLIMKGSAEVFSESVQTDTGRRILVETQPGMPRRIATLDEGTGPEEALGAWDRIRAEFGVSADNFECVTLCGDNGVNVHMGAEGGILTAGADMRSGTAYRLVASGNEEITCESERFCTRENALIIGCAGLKSAMLRVPATGSGSLALFLYGEIAEGCFGNLMMTGIRFNDR